MGISIFKNECSGVTLFLEKPIPDRKIRATTIGILTNELGVAYPRIYDIPVAVSAKDFERLNSKMYWDYCYTDFIDAIEEFRRKRITDSKVLTDDEYESLFLKDQPAYICAFRSEEILGESGEVTSGVRHDFHDILAEQGELVERLRHFGGSSSRSLSESGLLDRAEVKRSSESLIGVPAVVLQKVKIDTAMSVGSQNTRKSSFEVGDVVLLQARGPYKPVIHQIVDGSGLLWGMRLFKDLPDADVEMFTKPEEEPVTGGSTNT